jgi:two-component sensor histidine kinase
MLPRIVAVGVQAMRASQPSPSSVGHWMPSIVANLRLGRKIRDNRRNMEAAKHSAEDERVSALRSYGILDTPREEEFDEIVKVVSAICEAPISVINLIDSERQWFKAEVGLGVRETPLPASICAHAILRPGLFIVPDTLKDDRFSDNPLVVGDPRLRFYAGALLETPEGLPLGTICVLDYKPRELNDKQKALLRLMSRQIMKLFELRRINLEEQSARKRAERLAADNAALVRESDHRVMNSLQMVSAILTLQSRGSRIREAKEQIEAAQRRVQAIATVHRQLHLAGSLEEIEIGNFLRLLCKSLEETAPPSVESIDLSSGESVMNSGEATALGLIMAELIANSFKHAFPANRKGHLDVRFERRRNGWQLSMADDGIGLPAGFEIEKGTGVGMKVIVALVRRLKARVTFHSSSTGTTFTIDASE